MLSFHKRHHRIYWLKNYDYETSKTKSPTLSDHRSPDGESIIVDTYTHLMRIFLYVGWKFIFNMGNRHTDSFNSLLFRCTNLFLCEAEMLQPIVPDMFFSHPLGSDSVHALYFPAYELTIWSKILICLCTLRLFIGFYKYQMTNDKQRSYVVTSPCQMAVGQQRCDLTLPDGNWSAAKQRCGGSPTSSAMQWSP